jgi:hypothetical protein
MGQELGHAYEDLLEAALENILPQLEGELSSRFRLSPVRRMVGVSGNIDHLVESSDDGVMWRPFCLFMEKHSDSSNESEKHYRRHLEEYVQAKASSIINFGFPKQEPMKVINLIYGTKVGWKDVILQECRRRLVPSLILTEEPFYDRLDAMVMASVGRSRPPYDRHRIRKDLWRTVKRTHEFADFVRVIRDLLVSREQREEAWLSSQLANAVHRKVPSATLNSVAYIRRAMTELSILDSSLREKVFAFAIRDTTLSSAASWAPEEIRSMHLAIAQMKIVSSIAGPRIQLPSHITDFCRRNGSWALLKFSTDLFLGETDSYGMASRDYLAYLDIQRPDFIDAVQLAIDTLIAAIDGGSNDLVRFLAAPPPVNEGAMDKGKTSARRVQNVRLEALMAIASQLGKASSGTRLDLSTAALARHAGCTEAKIQRWRGGGGPSVAEAKMLSLGVLSFTSALPWNAGDMKKWLNAQSLSLRSWVRSKSTEGLELRPDPVDPESVMSIAWFRHNQLNGHPIFNPLAALVFKEWGGKLSSSGWRTFGFPRKRSASLAGIVDGFESTGASYEFSLVFWNAGERSLRVVETSSVINLKHTSDKSKELCAKIREVVFRLPRDIDAVFELVIDGDWTPSHEDELRAAGWDNVTYSASLVDSLGRKVTDTGSTG